MQKSLRTKNVLDEAMHATTKHRLAPNPEKTTYQKIIEDLRSTILSPALAPQHLISKTTRTLSLNI
ncbi:hypothetical protein HZS_4222 [Henneguya salminicola]|nr:hypothetical protein HZS_4222 [Henneguya salminicola]